MGVAKNSRTCRLKKYKPVVIFEDREVTVSLTSVDTKEGVLHMEAQNGSDEERRLVLGNIRVGRFIGTLRIKGEEAAKSQVTPLPPKSRLEIVQKIDIFREEDTSLNSTRAAVFPVYLDGIDRDYAVSSVGVQIDFVFKKITVELKDSVSMNFEESEFMVGNIADVENLIYPGQEDGKDKLSLYELQKKINEADDDLRMQELLEGSGIEDREKFRLQWKYYHARGDRDKAEYTLKQWAALKDPMAFIILSNIYLYSIETDEHKKQGISYAKELIGQGVAEGNYFMGYSLINGVGGTKNIKKGLDCLETFLNDRNTPSHKLYRPSAALMYADVVTDRYPDNLEMLSKAEAFLDPEKIGVVFKNMISLVKETKEILTEKRELFRNKAVIYAAIFLILFVTGLISNAVLPDVDTAYLESLFDGGF